MKGVAASAPPPAIIPLIEPIVGSYLSESHPPISDAGRPPPTTITVFMTEKSWTSYGSGYLCSKNPAHRNPRAYPPKKRKNPANMRETKHQLVARILHFSPNDIVLASPLMSNRLSFLMCLVTASSMSSAWLLVRFLMSSLLSKSLEVVPFSNC